MHSILPSNITLTNTLPAAEAIKVSTLSWPFFYDQGMQLLHTAAQLLPTLLLGVILLVISYLIAGPLSRLLIKPINFITDSKLVVLVARRGISTLIILLGLYLFLRLAGLTEFAVAIMSGTGLIGLILGFAFRDIAENFIASLLLSVQRPFKIDDVIEVDGRLGIVKKVTARATTLVDYDGNHIQIPNATVYKNTIKNLTANPKMRGKVEIGIGYDNDIRSTQTLALDIANQQAAVLSDPPAQVLIKNLGSSTINFILYFWVNGEQHSPLKVSSQLMRELVNEFTKQNISMPDDARERILLNTPNTELDSSEQPQSHSETKKTETHEQTQTLNDVSSDTDEIREQADQSRDPEQGKNII
ncbi:mechanosensitive ion channel [Pseudoalteromonas sp. SG45-5]|uniref:mechanosensitive ion channel family protein n=1 Tax=unclassified Pseudoalteromonas TaxID=194690 RepID=UPI0015F79AA8|nr:MULTISPECIES: mechanosensitive ion channel domain-containing protein [unclassified Pseudoalteromonas]MBB1385593.1 mechanosensitive ion channel [Pseudoalteromonas sp. SG45-5]MBB1394808.1 mechanosensitive ion channel [Pseudoalteromonas sp. SG44-4]MBB1448763.1 mechanosensitive ion channel [Pseudoalteromonas sp. SG41-6]